MTDTNGYIKLHRSILSWEWYGDIKTRGLFLHLLVAAQWEDVRIEGQVIKRGQLCTSIRKLADVVGLSERGVRTSLQRLQSTGEITMQSNQHHSIITVSGFFCRDTRPTHKTTHERHSKRHTDRHTRTTRIDTRRQTPKWLHRAAKHRQADRKRHTTNRKSDTANDTLHE